MKMNRLKIYQQRVEVFREEMEALKRKDHHYYIFRLVFFILLCILIYFFITIHWGLGILSIYIGLFAFYQLIQKHNKIRSDLTLYNRKIELNEAEVKLLGGDPSYFSSGDEFKDSAHPYVNDLDIFGNNSIYQHMCRCTFYNSENALAQLLKNLLDKDHIEMYQTCIKELESKIDFRQDIFSIGKEGHSDSEKMNKISAWIDQPRIFSFNIPVVIILSIVTIAAFVLLSLKIGLTAAFLAFIPSGLLIKKNLEPISKILSQTGSSQNLLQNFSDIIRYIESTDFQHPHLQQLKARFSSENLSSSKELKKLAYLTRQLELRYNFFGILINLFFLFDHYYATKIEDWKERNKDLLLSWFDAISEFEILNSLATLNYNNPDWRFPIITEETQIKAKALGHPLISSDNRISNDFASSSNNHIKIVTGSNMGGKSTFLRTVGINLVMAQTGSKVCAHELFCPLMKVFTSMRTEDDLAENTSSFYAELKRLKMVIEAVSSHENIYFLLDEILKGTNSNDRHKGAKAIIKQLLKNKGAGLISTHDLELGLLQNEYPEQTENICFEVLVEHGEMKFDYQLKKGISSSFNATQLMKNMGIEID